MPRIPDQLLNAVVYLYKDKKAALAGSNAGGTGFLIDYEDETAVWTYVVTNVHVVGHGCRTLRINTKDGGIDAVTIPASDWVNHPDGDDVSIAPLGWDEDASWAVQPLSWEDMGPTPERMEELNVGLGDEILMLGRFSGHPGREQNQPLARFGSLAMMDDEKIKDGRGLLVDAYLVEMRSLPGFSGSPVFICIGPGSWRGEGEMMPFYSNTVGLLGIDTGHKSVMSSVVDEKGKPVQPKQLVEQNSGVAIVAPYYKITEILEGDDLMAEREKGSEDANNDPERGTSDAATDEANEFQQFEDLAKRVVKTPKPKKGKNGD